MQYHALKQLYPIAIQAIAPMLHRNHDPQPKNKAKINQVLYACVCNLLQFNV